MYSCNIDTLRQNMKFITDTQDNLYRIWFISLNLRLHLSSSRTGLDPRLIWSITRGRALDLFNIMCNTQVDLKRPDSDQTMLIMMEGAVYACVSIITCNIVV